MVVRKTVCLRRLGGSRGGELRAGRFFANPKVTAEKIIEKLERPDRSRLRRAAHPGDRGPQ